MEDKNLCCLLLFFVVIVVDDDDDVVVVVVVVSGSYSIVRQALFSSPSPLILGVNIAFSTSFSPHKQLECVTNIRII